MRERFEIGGQSISPGEHRLIDLPLSRLSNHTPVSIPVHVMHGTNPGPVLFVSAAVHGDEINGIEIVRQLIRGVSPDRISGTLLAVPIVNAYGFIGRSRYLPDRRDLNRSFPGSASGSLAARIANLFLTEVVARSNFGIDLHTAAIHRVNLPQIRSAFVSGSSERLAKAFNAPVMVRSDERDGSLRKAARAHGVDVLVYEGGEGLRFDEFAIRAGVNGILGVMREIDMLLPGKGLQSPAAWVEDERETLLADASKWLRAPDGGVLRSNLKLGDAVTRGEIVGTIANPYEGHETQIRSPRRGIVIGRTTLPIVNMGDALFHVAWSNEMDLVREYHAPGSTSAAEASDEPDPLMDEDEIL